MLRICHKNLELHRFRTYTFNYLRFDRGEIGFRVPLERQRQRRTGLEVTKCGCDGKDVVGDGSPREESDLGS